MSWTIYQPQGPATNALQRGQASVVKDGELRLHASDVAAAGITGVACVIEIDAGGRRFSLREPGRGEPTLVLRDEPKGGARRRVSIAGVLRSMGVGRDELPNRLRVEIQPGRLIVLLPPTPHAPHAPRAGDATSATSNNAAESSAEPAPAHAAAHETEATSPYAQRAAKRATPIGRARPLKEIPQP